MDRQSVRRVVLLRIGVPLLFALFMFVPANNIRWGKGWLFLLAFVVLDALAAVYVWRTNPELLVARHRRHQGTKPWDKVLLCLFFLSVMAIFSLAALDDGRLHWSRVPLFVCGLGYLLLVVGLILTTWAGSVNKFAERTVRIQTDRGHKVIDTGPYALVRHPGYLAAFFWFAGIALALGSFWALVPGAVASTILVVRTFLEDQTLQKELEGYREYVARVRYRLIPGIW